MSDKTNSILSIGLFIIGLSLCIYWYDYKLFILISILMYGNNFNLLNIINKEQSKNKHIIDLQNNYIKYLEEKLNN